MKTLLTYEVLERNNLTNVHAFVHQSGWPFLPVFMFSRFGKQSRAINYLEEYADLKKEWENELKGAENAPLFAPPENNNAVTD